MNHICGINKSDICANVVLAGVWSMIIYKSTETIPVFLIAALPPWIPALYSIYFWYKLSRGQENESV
jgi:hypothetical protein